MNIDSLCSANTKYIYVQLKKTLTRNATFHRYINMSVQLAVPDVQIIWTSLIKNKNIEIPTGARVKRIVESGK